MHPYEPKGKPDPDRLLRNKLTVGGATGTILFLKGNFSPDQNEQILEGILKIGFWLQIRLAASIPRNSGIPRLIDWCLWVEPEEYIGISRI